MYLIIKIRKLQKIRVQNWLQLLDLQVMLLQITCSLEALSCKLHMTKICLFLLLLMDISHNTTDSFEVANKWGLVGFPQHLHYEIYCNVGL